jgi:hypothetical protein
MKQSLQNQTLYAELLDQTRLLERFRSIGSLDGGFVTKTINGDIYIYFQFYSPGGAKKQLYLGKQSDELRILMEQYIAARGEFAPDLQNIQRLCAQLRVGGALTTDHASAKIIKKMAESGVFHLGGVLVGTHAYIALGNVLGVAWDHAALRTQDIDIAGIAKETDLAVVLPDLDADIPAALDSLQMGFLPVPPFNHKDPSTSFKVRGSGIRLDVLTPQKGESTSPVYLRRFRTGAQPLRFLEYLLEDRIDAVIIDGGGILVSVPSPARFAVHKMIISGERDLSMQAKKTKDLWQAAQIFSVLQEERPGDVTAAIEAATAKGQGWAKRVQRGHDEIKKRFGIQIL